MKKILITFIATICITCDANAGFNYDTEHKCMYSHLYWDWTGGRQVVHCGANNGKCAGYYGRKSIEKYLLHGEKFTYKNNDGDPWWCCNGTSTQAGRLYRAPEFEKTEEITVTLPLGTCKYNKITDICGNVIRDEPCTVASDCNTDNERNGKCITECPTGFAFESETSNDCIECPTTQSQGIRGTKMNKICIKCNDNQIWNTKSQKCSEKISLLAISGNVMEQCWQCPDSNLYKDCVKSLAKQQELSDAIKTKCKISE